MCDNVRVCAGMCGYARRCARVCKDLRGLYENARLCEDVQGCARMCEDVQGCARMCKHVRVFEDERVRRTNRGDRSTRERDGVKGYNRRRSSSRSMCEDVRRCATMREDVRASWSTSSGTVACYLTATFRPEDAKKAAATPSTGACWTTVTTTTTAHWTKAYLRPENHSLRAAQCRCGGVCKGLYVHISTQSNAHNKRANPIPNSHPKSSNCPPLPGHPALY